MKGKVKYQIIVHHLASGVTYCSIIIESSEENLDATKNFLNKAAASQLAYIEFEGQDGNNYIIPELVLQQSVITLKTIKE